MEENMGDPEQKIIRVLRSMHSHRAKHADKTPLQLRQANAELRSRILQISALVACTCGADPFTDHRKQCPRARANAIMAMATRLAKGEK